MVIVVFFILVLFLTCALARQTSSKSTKKKSAGSKKRKTTKKKASGVSDDAEAIIKELGKVQRNLQSTISKHISSVNRKTTEAAKLTARLINDNWPRTNLRPYAREYAVPAYAVGVRGVTINLGNVAELLAQDSWGNDLYFQEKRFSQKPPMRVDRVYYPPSTHGLWDEVEFEVWGVAESVVQVFAVQSVTS